MRPLAEWQPGGVRGLLFDIDDTLTTRGKLSAADKARITGGNAARLLKIDYNSRTRRRTS